MRYSSVLVSLLASAASAPAVVLAAPLPIVLIEGWNGRVPLGAKLPARLPDLIFSKTRTTSDDATATPVSADNRPFTPSDDIDPSDVLATPRPITTTYLMGLAKSPTKVMSVRVKVVADRVIQDVLAAAPGGDDDRLRVDANDGMPTDDVPAPDEMERLLQNDRTAAALDEEPTSSFESMAVHFRTSGASGDYGAPCHYSDHLRREYDDMTVIIMVAVFLLVIVAIELWDSGSEQSAPAPATGAIRLEGVVAVRDTEKQPLSVQASPAEPEQEQEQDAAVKGRP